MCGIAGFIKLEGSPLGANESARLGLGLLAGIEDRGKDACGILAVGKRVLSWKEPVEVKEFVARKCVRNALFSDPSFLLLHTRQATSGDKKDNRNNHPVILGGMHLIHNGIITNSEDLKKGPPFPGEEIPEVDTAGILCAIARQTGDTISRIATAAGDVSGSMSCVLWKEDEPDRVWLWANKNRPLAVGLAPLSRVIAFSSSLSGLEEGTKTLSRDVTLVFKPLLVHEPSDEVLEITRAGVLRKEALRPEKVKVYVYSGYSGWTPDGQKSADADAEIFPCEICRGWETNECAACNGKGRSNGKYPPAFSGDFPSLDLSSSSRFSNVKQFVARITSASKTQDWWNNFRELFALPYQKKLVKQAYSVVPESARSLKRTQYIYAVQNDGSITPLWVPGSGESLTSEAGVVGDFRGAVESAASLASLYGRAASGGVKHDT